MRTLVLSACVFALALAQWSVPIPLPTDSGTGLIPAVAAMADSDLYCAWVAGYAGGQEHQIRGSHYIAATGAWDPPANFTTRSTLVSATGPGLSLDPFHSGLRVAYYRGSFPTDDDTWGIYNMFADSTGIGPDLRAMGDTAVGTVILRFNDSGQVGMLWTDETGAGLEMYSSVWFSMMSGDTWLPRQLVAAGMGSPTYVDCHTPGMCRDTGVGFDAAYVRQVATPPSSTVRVVTLPDTTTFGTFEGTDPALVNDLHGSILLVYVASGAVERYLLAQFYQGGAWSPPETLTADVTPGVRPRVCVDNEGLFWVAYCSGISSPPFWLNVRFYAGGHWSAPEQVAPGGFTASPVIVPTYSGNIWLVWNSEAAPPGLSSARRLSRPTVSERLMIDDLRFANGLEVRPTVSTAGFRVLSRVPVDVYDAAGRHVNRVLGRWSGRDRNGSRLEPGVYYLRSGTARSKVVLR